MSKSGIDYVDNEANWEIPLIRSDNPVDTYGVSNNLSGNSRGSNRRPTKNNSALVSSKQVFNGLACLLVASLCFLLLELRQPGVAHRTAKRMYNNMFLSAAPISLHETPVISSNYSPVPAPFLKAPKAQFVSGEYVSPTSEPTVLIGHLRGIRPTSEPTEFSDVVIEHVPTSEPTEYRDLEERYQSLVTSDSHPTHEPTIFDANSRLPGQHGPTSEPTIFFVTSPSEHNNVPTYEPTIFGQTFEPTAFGQSGEPTTFGQTAEPTIFGQTGEPTIFGQTGEPTIFGGSSGPTVFGQSGEPTVFGLTGEPTIFGPRVSAEPTVFGDHDNQQAESSQSNDRIEHERGNEDSSRNDGERQEGTGGDEIRTPTYEPTTFGEQNLPGVYSPTAEPTMFNERNIPAVNTPTVEPTTFNERNIPEVNSPTQAPSQPPNMNTWGPTSFVSFAPTSDPTIFPTPEPTMGI